MQFFRIKEDERLNVIFALSIIEIDALLPIYNVQRHVSILQSRRSHTNTIYFLNKGEFAK
jgi:hypothetical protein